MHDIGWKISIFIANIFDDSSWIQPKINGIGLTFVSVTKVSFSLTASTAACISSFGMAKLLPFSGANHDFAITNLQMMSSCAIALKYVTAP